MTIVDEYKQFVTHPRYGQRPRITGLNPETDFNANIFLHWHTPKECRIPYTAISADLSKQSAATVPVTHYFDAKRQCRDCGRAFIFFAEEQKYWYEEMGFAWSPTAYDAWCAENSNRISNENANATRNFSTSRNGVLNKTWNSWIVV